MHQPHRHRRPRAAALSLIAAAALATTACTESSDPNTQTAAEGGTVDPSQLVEMVNEGLRLEQELTAAEYRIITECLEAQGFTIHDQRYVGQNNLYEVESLVDHYPTSEFLPEADAAAEWGFGWWAEQDSESDEAQAYYEEAFDFPWDDEPVFDNDAFESQPDADRRAWAVAYHGEEMVADLEGTGEASGGSAEDGELEFEGGTQTGPKPGGCLLEMIESLYGDLRQVEIDPESGSMTWQWELTAPSIDLDAVTERYAADTAEAQEPFLSCLAEGGHPGWVFGEDGRLAMSDYSSLLYTGEIYEEEWLGDGPRPADTTPPVPDLPGDAPTDYEGQRAYEIDMAVAFAACADDTGYRETADTAYETILADQYAAIETETYAWQEEMRQLITKAQEIIGA
ncbi:hypothetical protein AB0B28_10385 [Glycomyces sp. NPDC046736]|uniref:hypothetical protein n=1 Tax=Glycomyces sp. NPDC046736 TaxID=3155615 RepID=UPI0033FE536B